jgi:[acyl-carrier-protein] S-malonyltransferase
MASASEKMAQALEEVNISPPQLMVYSNLTARPYQESAAKDWLARQLASPVKWEETIRNLAEAGFDTFLELGPGKVLCGLIGKILPGAVTLQAEDMAGIAQAALTLGGKA